jgi:hypothetical protein
MKNIFDYLEWLMHGRNGADAATILFIEICEFRG